MAMLLFLNFPARLLTEGFCNCGFFCLGVHMDMSPRPWLTSFHSLLQDIFLVNTSQKTSFRLTEIPEFLVSLTCSFFYIIYHSLMYTALRYISPPSHTRTQSFAFFLSFFWFCTAIIPVPSVQWTLNHYLFNGWIKTKQKKGGVQTFVSLPWFKDLSSYPFLALGFVSGPSGV